jgi:hypothetical protein
MERAVDEYKKDYESFYVESESKPLDVGMPFLVKGRSKRIGVVLSHGQRVGALFRAAGSVGLCSSFERTWNVAG